MIGPTSTLSVVQGATLTRVLQGENLDNTTPTQFTGADTLTGTVWLAQAETAVVSFTPVWFVATSCQVTVTLTAAQTAMLAIDTQYNLQVFATRSAVPYCIAWVYLQILPAAGSQAVAAPPDLVTGPYVAQLLAQLNLNTAQLEAIPSLITVASAAIRKWCMDNYFTQKTWVEEYLVALNGEIRLNQVPVNQILRIQSELDNALNVQNSTAQIAQVYFTLTGDAATGQTITGLTLSSITAGVQTVTPIVYTSNETIASLAAAINLVGGGWSASTTGNYTQWPVTELVGGKIAQGATPSESCSLGVFSQDISTARFHPDNGQFTGIVYCGEQVGGTGPRWGPDWIGWVDEGPDASSLVKVTYNAGYAVIPYPVQLATVELVQFMLNRLRTDLLLQSETGGEYSYTIAYQLIKALPMNVTQGLVQYVIHNA